MKFHDLGLLIIDEEQKFGVAAKEKLTQMSVNVDTLTLTATPIPRTLQFSLMGSRDLSVISTPPPNRQPIITESHRLLGGDYPRRSRMRELDRAADRSISSTTGWRISMTLHGYGYSRSAPGHEWGSVTARCRPNSSKS